MLQAEGQASAAESDSEADDAIDANRFLHEEPQGFHDEEWLPGERRLAGGRASTERPDRGCYTLSASLKLAAICVDGKLPFTGLVLRSWAGAAAGSTVLWCLSGIKDAVPLKRFVIVCSLTC